MAEQPAKHIAVISKPSDKADLKKLQTIFALCRQTAKDAQASLLSCQEIDNSQPREIAPGVFQVMLGGDSGFQGLHFCKHCMLDAALSLRDLADICEDIVKEGEKYAVQE